MGALNGALSAKLMLPSFIVTVATMGIFRGAVSLPTNGAPAMIENEPWLAIGAESFVWACRSSSGSWSVLFVINHIVLSKSIFGRQIYLTGGNREAAIYSGIKRRPASRSSSS
jgi:ribose transport system permease protein